MARATTAPPAAHLCALAVAALSVAVAACDRAPRAELAVGPAGRPAESASDAAAKEATEAVSFAVIGDYGTANQYEQDVADLVSGTLAAEFVVTVGDNTYIGIDDYATAVGGYYGQYLPTPSGSGPCPYDLPAVDFYPAPGNHDTNNADMDEYSAYFPWASQTCSTTVCDGAAETWINNLYFPDGGGFSCDLADTDLFYDVVRGPVHLISMNSQCLGEKTDVYDGCLARILDCRSSDWFDSTSQCEKNYCVQLLWMEYAVAQQAAPWHLAFYHHAPYSTQTGTSHPSCLGMQYDYADAGVTTVVTGHEHFYERFAFDGKESSFTYFVNGAGGYVESHVCNSGVTPVLNPDVPYPSYLGTLEQALGYEGKQKNGWGAQLAVADTSSLSLTFFDADATDPTDFVDRCQGTGGSALSCDWGNATDYPQAVCCDDSTGVPTTCP